MTILSENTLKAFGKKADVGSGKIALPNSGMKEPQKVQIVGGV
jgi:hypothetical protein